MRALLRLLLGLAAWGLAWGPVNVAAAEASLVRIVADERVLEGKLERMQSIAASAGVRLEYAVASALPGGARKWLAGADLVLIEAPLPSAQARVQELLSEALRQPGVRWVSGGPRTAGYGGLPDEQARAFIAYYRNGGETNIRNLFAYMQTFVSGGDLSRVPPPDPVPESGFYHPDAPRLFTSLDEYMNWGGDRWKRDAPRVALAIHAFTLAGMQTQVIDTLVLRAEALGLMPLAFWFDVDDADALSKVLVPSRAEVLINMHHMGNGSARSAEFLDIDIPVLQTMNYRDGSIADWRAASSGSAPRMVAPFIAVYENWGMTDPMVIGAVEKGELRGMPAQIDAVLRKAAALTRLERTPNAEKRLALMFWNYPPGEKNLAASNLNVPQSLAALSEALQAAGYEVPHTSEQRFIEVGQAMLSPLYRHETLDDLLEQGLAAALPVERYREWLDSLSTTRRAELLKRWGEPEAHWAVRSVGGEPCFVIPRLELGKLLVMPQMLRGDDPGAAYHDGAVPPSHYYLAAYLYLRESFAPHALIHFGTHGTQEWLPGKDRALSVQDDYPLLAIGDVPVFYPYIQDNIGEALQAKRRGRAVIVSHQTPAFAPSGLYEDLLDVHSLLHEYLQLDTGVVRDRTAERIRELTIDRGLDKDIDWTEADMVADFDGFLGALHDYLHELASRNTPLGLHTLGSPPAPEHRLTTVLQQLGDEFIAAAMPQDTGDHAGHGMAVGPDEVFARTSAELQETVPYRVLRRHLRENIPPADIADPALRTWIERAIELDSHLSENQELAALLDGLAGRFVPPGPGGDPVRNPDVPNGRNLYGFEPDKLPARSAYEAAEETLQALIEDYRGKHDGRTPQKLAFSLWSVEAMRHMGVTESQVLHALGLRPVWDAGGRVTALEIIPARELQRPRIDAVVQVTGVYRDQFDGFMRMLSEAIERLSQLNEPSNTVRQNSVATAQRLIEQGIAPAQAQRMGSVRLFGNRAGDYGVGLDDAVLDSTSWESDSSLAEQYLSRLQYAYGSGADAWGVALSGANLYAEQLKGVQAAVLSRSSNLYGVLTGDDPYQFLGGLSLAVRHLNGSSPDLYISDLRRPTAARMTSAARFLAEEMRTRYLNPQWITAMQDEGYSGTLEVVDTANNLWGWQVMDASTVRADQWQALHDVYIMDRYELDIEQWFEAYNPTAQAQVIERMLEAIRKGYWDAAEQTRRELAQRWHELAERGVETGAEITRAFARQMAQGYGLQAPGAASAPESVSQSATQAVRGNVMQEVTASSADDPYWRMLLALAALLAFMIGGAAFRVRENRASSA